jgi:toxin ParE1/3/4
MSFRLRPRALCDLEAIIETITVDNPQAAARWIEAIHRRCQLLADNPEMGALRDDIRRGMRIVPVGSYLILYRLTGSDAEIVRVLHGARDLKRIFGDP